MTFDFKEQLALGDRGEEIFLERYHRKIEIYPKHDFDFISKCRKHKIELKTDTYNMDKTENFFIERWSDLHKERPGSIWQSIPKGVNIFCYMFVRHNVYFEFTNLPALRDFLDDYLVNKSYVAVKNKGWITAGYKVPRDLLSDYYEVYEW